MDNKTAIDVLQNLHDRAMGISIQSTVMGIPRNDVIIASGCALHVLKAYEEDMEALINMRDIECDRCLIRCKDCALGEPMFGAYACEYGYHEGDFYCGYAKPKECLR